MVEPAAPQAQPSFPRQGRKIFENAVIEAARRGSSTVEAEHLVLALLDNPASETSTFLLPAGLSHSSFDAALDAERSHSLAVAGIAMPWPITPTTPRKGRGSWGASLRETLNQMRRHGPRDRRSDSLELELLRCILAAELGTMPRTLALAGVDRTSLLAELPQPKGSR